MGWYAVRSVYFWQRVPDPDRNLFEERVVCVEAATDDEAFAKAEAGAYAVRNGFTVHPGSHLYVMDNDPLIDGHELWSVMMESPLDLKAFYAARYAAFDRL
ncbi:MAG: hypothetical protein JWO31_2371 [Phycisphaerales bacterium]|nr:hypothetical protein [Phycisphaerales bacterium]